MSSAIDFSRLEEVIEEVLRRQLNEINEKKAVNEKEWLNLKEGAKYLGVSYNTFKKFMVIGLKIVEIEGVRRVSIKELNRFMYENKIK